MTKPKADPDRIAENMQRRDLSSGVEGAGQRFTLFIGDTAFYGWRLRGVGVRHIAAWCGRFFGDEDRLVLDIITQGFIRETAFEHFGKGSVLYIQAYWFCRVQQVCITEEGIPRLFFDLVEHLF